MQKTSIDCYRTGPDQLIAIQIQRGITVFQISEYYIIVPQFLYNIFLLGGGLTALAALGMLVKGAAQKKGKTYFANWGLLLFISCLLFWLSYTGKICGHRMIGG